MGDDNDNNNDKERPFTEDEMQKIREKTIETLTALDEELAAVIQDNRNNNTTIPFWIDHNHNNDVTTTPTATTTEEKKDDEPNITNKETTQEETEEQQKAVCYFNYYGFLKIPNFSDDGEVNGLRQEMYDIVEKEWDPNSDEGDTFGTDDKSNSLRGDYFLESASRVHFFVEPKAQQEQQEQMNKNHNHKDEKQQKSNNSNNKQPKKGNVLLKEEYNNNSSSNNSDGDDNNDHDNNNHSYHKMDALNKIGHGLHIRGESSRFERYTLSKKLQSLVLRLGWKDPVVPQSMYICKQPRVGGVVTSHQDSTFLYTTPKQSCLGLWLALHPATLQNGCLWVRPKSHNDSLRRQYKRNTKYFGDAAIQQRSNVPLATTMQGKKHDDDNATTATTAVDFATTGEPKFVMDVCDAHGFKNTAPWEGKLPTPATTTTTTTQAKNHCNDDNDHDYESLFRAGFVPIECNAGDLLVFPGLTDHLSLPNYSNQPRHTFQLHLVEGEKAGVFWSPYNWLQYSTDNLAQTNKEEPEQPKSFLSLLRGREQ